MSPLADNHPDRPVASVDVLREMVAAERERCAKVCEQVAEQYRELQASRGQDQRAELRARGALECAEAIRGER